MPTAILRILKLFFIIVKASIICHDDSKSPLTHFLNFAEKLAWIFSANGIMIAPAVTMPDPKTFNAKDGL